MKQPFLLLCFILILNSCNSEFKPAAFKTITIEKPFEADITATYDTAIGENELSKIINFNIEKGIVKTFSDAPKKTNLEAILKDFNAEYLNFKKEFPDASELKWELHIESEKGYQSKEVITIFINTYEFKGGAHGNDKISFINLDAKTGEVLNLDAIIENKNDFKTLAEKHFVKSLELKDDNLKIEDFFFGKPFQLPEHIGFSDDGLVFLYNVYEVASFDQGYTEFVIPFKDVSSYLKVN